MSELEFESGVGGDVGEVLPAEPFDPFDPASVSAYQEQRDARFLERFDELLGGVRSPEVPLRSGPAGGFESVPAVPLSAEEESEAAAQMSRVLDEAAATLGPLDEERVLEVAEQIFAGMPGQDRAAGEQAMQEAARMVAAEAAGEEVAWKFVDAEVSQRPRLDRQMVYQLAQQLLPQVLAQTGGDGFAAGQAAIAAAAHELSRGEKGEAPAPSLNRPSLANKYALRSDAEHLRTRSERVLARPIGPRVKAAPSLNRPSLADRYGED